MVHLSIRHITLITSSLILLGVVNGCNPTINSSTPITPIIISTQTQSLTASQQLLDTSPPNTPQSTPSLDGIPTQGSQPSPNVIDILSQITVTPVLNQGQNYYGTIIITDRGDDSAFLLYNYDGTRNREYILDSQTYHPLLAEKITDQCDLIALVSTDVGHKLLQIDSGGNIVKEIFHLEFTDVDGNHRYFPMISPTGDYVAYVVFSGTLYYDNAEYQDIEVVPLNQPDNPVRITSHGGAWKNGGAWSPDGTQLAYTDYDEQGRLQINITTINSWNNHQLTEFRSSQMKPGPISWSPKGDRLAVILDNANNNREVWIVSVPHRTAQKLSLPDGVVTIADKVYWSDDGSTILLSVGDYSESGLEGLYWFDIEYNQLTNAFTLARANEINSHIGSFYAHFPLSLDLSNIVFNGNPYEWFSYEYKNSVLAAVSWLDTRQWGTHLDVSIFRENIFVCDK